MEPVTSSSNAAKGKSKIIIWVLSIMGGCLLLGCLLGGIGLIIYGDYQSNNSAAMPSTQQSEASPTHNATRGQVTSTVYFPITVEQFVARYNIAMANMQRGITVKDVEEIDNGKFLTIKLTGNKYMGLLVAANKKNRKLHDFTFIGMGDGTDNSSVDILMGISACFMAVENPDMLPDGRHEILEQLELLDGRFFKTGFVEIERNGVKYTLMNKKKLGILLIGVSSEDTTLKNYERKVLRVSP